MSNEADTCRKFVVPELQAAGWDTDPHRLNEQVTFTDGRIIASGSKGRRRPGKRADYRLRCLRGAQGQVQLRSREKGDWKREKVGFRLTELNVADMRKVPVPVPSPAEQRRIVEYVEKVRSKVDTMRTLQAKTAAELDAMLPAVLDRAFRGEL
jgi:hypothetical protein